MAANDIEVEIKLALDEKSFARIREQLQKTAKFLRSTSHMDEYYTPAHRNFVSPKYPFEWLSIRKRGERTILNYKHFLPEDAEVHTHCDEFETEVGKADKLEKMFSSLNFRKLATIDKQRETYDLDGEFEVALDTVKELGHFIEIEAMKDFGGIVATRARLFALARLFGLDPANEDMRGYPFLLMRKKGLL
ncbi:MAG: class IV adenylate cyclase [Candidatus Aenigmatarchaeota archaeon]